MRYVFIPLPSLTGGSPGTVYLGWKPARSGCGSGGISVSTFRTRLHLRRGLSGAILIETSAVTVETVPSRTGT